MKKFSAVVYTAGRTGSHLIINNLCRHYHVTRQLDSDRSIVDGIVHTHNPLYIPPTENFIAIISRRHNQFESILSMELTKLTNEFVAYTNKEITPFAINLAKFKNCYLFQKAFYQAIDRTRYTKVVDIDYEDLISNPTCLVSDFNVKIDLSLTKKSPYNYYNLVTNIKELKETFQELEQKSITPEEIENFKKTIESDLMDIRINHKGNRL